MITIRTIEDVGQHYWQHHTEINYFCKMNLIVRNHFGFKFDIVATFKEKFMCYDAKKLDKVKSRTIDNWLIILN